MGVLARLGLRRERGSARSTPAVVVPRLDEPRRGTYLGENPIIYGAVYRLAFRLGALPLKVYRLRSGRGRPDREEAADHPAALLLRRPNPQITRSYLISGTVQDMLLHGYAVWLLVGSPPREIWPVDARLVRPLADESNLFTGAEIVSGGRRTRIPAERLCFFRLIASPDGWALPYTPIVPLRLVADMGYEALDAAAELYSSGVLERRYLHSSEEMSDAAYARIVSRLAEARADRGKMPVVEGDLEIRSMGSGPDDEAMIRGMDAAGRLILQTLGLPTDDDDRKFYANAIGPLADAIEQELERSFLSRWADDPAFCEFAFRELLKGTPQERAEYHQTLVQSGLETLDEARSDLDLPPLPDGTGSRAFVPLNLVEVTQTSPRPRRRDTAGGFGGGEEGGRGILPRVAAASPPPVPRALQPVLRGLDGWKGVRERLVSSQAEAAYRRIRGELLRESRRLRELLEPPRVRSAQGGVMREHVGLPSIEEIQRILEETDPALAELLRTHMRRTSLAAWDAARDLVAASAEEMAEAVVRAIEARVEVAVSRFGAVRAEDLQGLLSSVLAGEFGVGELASKIADLYEGRLAAYLADGLARDSIGYAFEQSGIIAWAYAGIERFAIVFGGGPCTTGICQQAAAGGPYRLGEEVPNVGASFEGIDTPPLHPNCTCYTVPALDGANLVLTGAEETM